MADPNGTLRPIDQLLVDVVEQKLSRRQVLMRGLALGLTAPVLGTLLAACGGDDDDEDPTSTTGASGTSPAGTTGSPETSPTAAAGETPSGGTEPPTGAASGKLVISLAAEPFTLENWNAYSTDGYPVNRNCQEALLNRNPETNELVGELATSWEQIDDLTWHFTLREGVTFHNGEAFTPEVAAFGINYTWDPENVFDILQVMGPQITAEAVDDTIVAVMTAEPDPIIPNRLYFAPLPSMQQIEDEPDTLVDKPIGTGPYEFVEWVKGERILLKRYEDWWGHSADDAHGAATIAEVEFVFRAESSVRASQVSAGEAHIARFLSPEDCETTPNCQEAASVETVFLRLDTNHELLSDVRIRQAISMAVDRESLGNEIFGGGLPASQLVGPSANGYNADLEPTPYDLEGASALVEEVAAEGAPVDMELVVAVRKGAYNRTEELGEYVANQLVEIGLNARSEVIENAAYMEQYVLPFEEISADRGWITTLPHGNEMMDLGQSFGYYRCDGSVSTWCDPELDALIDEALVTTGEERGPALAAVTAKFMESHPVVPLVHMPLFYGIAESLQWTPRLDAFILVKEMTLSE